MKAYALIMTIDEMIFNPPTDLVEVTTPIFIYDDNGELILEEGTADPSPGQVRVTRHSVIKMAKAFGLEVTE
jgi:hypothetical protein